MKTTIDYSKSPAPDFDCVADVQAYLGKRYDSVAEQFKKLNADQFTIACSFIGIEGRPIRAWFDHFHGKGAYAKEWML